MDEEMRRLGILPVSYELLGDLLGFPKGTELVCVASDDRTHSAIRFLIRSSVLPHVPWGEPVPEAWLIAKHIEAHVELR